MALFEKIQNKMFAAAKARDKIKLSTLRLLVSAVKNREIALKKSLDDDEILQVISKEAKQRNDSIEAYKKADRNDLASKEEQELAILKGYLPEELPDNELEKIIKETISELNALKDNFGQVMGAVLKKVQGRANGQRVAAKVKELI